MTERLELRELNCPAYANLVFALSRISLGVVATNRNERGFRPIPELMRALMELLREYEPYLTPIEVALVAKGFEYINMRNAFLGKTKSRMTPNLQRELTEAGE